MAMELYAEKPGQSYDEGFWRAVRTLYDEAFPGFPAGIDRAERLGYRWSEVTTPFAMFEGERCVAHVGVLVHPMRFHGELVAIAGIHAVCTAADRRRRGLARDLLGRALAWSEGAHAVAKLHTDVPEVYTGHGFRPLATWRFRSQARPASGVRKRRLQPLKDPADAALLRALLRERTPVSERCASADDGWMVGIVAALSNRLERAMWWLPAHEAVVVFDEQDDSTLVVDIIARSLPAAEVIAGAAPDPERPRFYAFNPDRIEKAAEAVPAPQAIGTFMVRGQWPGAAPFGLSPLWEH